MAEGAAGAPPNRPSEETEGIGRVRPQPLEREMHRSYIDYAMSVIVGRALPVVEDGLKPVHRRILWSMWESGATHDRPFRKSARTVGDVLGKYHPHGDLAVYDALVRMAQPFSLRYPLIEGQGNFGSLDGDSAAAMRYTEARLSRIAEEMLADIDKETVDWRDNFDGTLKEPLVLPSRVPNLLINGSDGIAVGMATSLPPHNLREVVRALRLLLRKPEATLEEILEVLPAPDFPTGGLISRSDGIREAYATGRGMLRLRARAQTREREGRSEIVVTEIPYHVNKAELLSLVAELIKSRKIEGISDLRDESDKEGISIVFELRRDAQVEVVLNQLYAHTPLESSFSVINLALVDGKPRTLGLKDLLELHLAHRRRVITRRSEFDKRKAEERRHLLEGFLIAIDHIEEVIRIIRRSRDVAAAQSALMGKFLLSDEQAKAILDMRLARLTALERDGVQAELKQKEAEIADLRRILSDPRALDGLIDQELQELDRTFGDERRTQIIEGFTERSLEDLIPDVEVVVLVTNDGYIKRLPLDTYRRQRRGGKGLVQMETKEQDFVTRAFVTRTHDHVLFFTNRGRVYRLKAYEIPEMGRHSKGKAIVNLLPRLREGERVQTELPVSDLSGPGSLLFATRRGLVKRTELSRYQNIRTNGIQAILLEEGDELVDVVRLEKGQEVILATREGQVVRFQEEEVRPTGRATFGVRGLRLKDEGDAVVSLSVVSPEFPSLLTLTSTGFGKRSPVSDYRLTRRGASGVITIRTGERNGHVVAVLPVREEDEILVTTQKGVTLRSPVRQVREQGRNTLGVIIMRLEEGDEVRTAVRLVPPGETSSLSPPAGDGSSSEPSVGPFEGAPSAKEARGEGSGDETPPSSED